MKKCIYSNNYLLEMINSSTINFDQTISAVTGSRFSNFVDFVRITEINQNNDYVK